MGGHPHIDYLLWLKDKLRHVKNCKSLSKNSLDSDSIRCRGHEGALRRCTKWKREGSGHKAVALGCSLHGYVSAGKGPGPSGRLPNGCGPISPGWFKFPQRGETRDGNQASVGFSGSIWACCFVFNTTFATLGGSFLTLLVTSFVKP